MKRNVMNFFLKLFFLIVMTFGPLSVSAQEKIGLQYKNEKVVGVNFNTNGGLIGGVFGKYSTRISENSLRTLSLEVVNVKHPQETKVPSNSTGNTFIFGKENYFFVVRPSLGKEWIVFPPAKEDGVQVNGAVSGGMSLGIIKPYHVKYDYSVSQDMSNVKDEAYDPEIHSNGFRILGNGSFFNGFDEAKLAPGFHLKGSVTFYFGNFEKRVSGIEAGGLIEAFVKPGSEGGGIIEPNRINIIPFAEKDWLFTSLYVNIFYGWRK